MEAENEIRKNKKKARLKEDDSPVAPASMALSKDVSSIAGDQDEDIFVEDEDKAEEKPEVRRTPSPKK